MNNVKESVFNKLKMRAISRVYLDAIIKATPGQGDVALGWDIKMEGDDVVIYNEEFGDIVLYLEEGTKEHIIRAKNKKFLKFKKPSGPRKKKSSKPIPGNVAFEKDGFIFAKAVRHPGIVARLFIHQILHDAQLKKDFENELDTLIKESFNF